MTFMSANSVHILLVEDAADTAQMISQILENADEGVQVTVDRNLEQARHLLAHFSPDLVIADLLLPDGKGTELLAGEKESAAYPTIILTGHGDEQAAVDAMRAGALDYVVKSGDSMIDIPRTAGRAIREWRHITERIHAEELLKRRTAELATVNREMESFIYSVSHDLRALLSGINGYSHLLLEDFGEALPEEAKRYVNRIRTGSEKMADLIKELNHLSRLTRNDPEIEMLDLSSMAQSAFTQLKEAQPQRHVVWQVEPDIIAFADKRLMRVVLECLLGNAWKFTSQIAEAQLYFGTLATEKNTVYYVRDNGPGFDAGKAEKLFTPFYRLPNASGFEGNGLGLVTVKRIIHRHGGETWAEAEPGKGATFYFTLPRHQ